MPSHNEGPCIWITRANYQNHAADYTDYHIHIIEDETGPKQ